MKHREETAKVDLLQSCESFKLWSKQPLANVANLIRLNSFPPNTSKFHFVCTVGILTKG